MLSYQKVGTSTIQSRATGGVAGGTYLFALPGSPGACRDGSDDISNGSSTAGSGRATWSS
jgi:molybdenum cofactor biosynthesis protein B